MARLDQDNDGGITQYVMAIWEADSKDLTNCELCKEPVEGKNAGIHHTKYEGATLYDLVWACHYCNTRPINKYLV